MNTKKRRSLGQHLLVDKDVLGVILDSAKISRYEVVYEVGTGQGILTGELCKRARRVISCEVDANMLAGAKKVLGKYDNLLLLHGDGFKFNHKFDVFISNLPYSESRKAIEWLATRKFGKAILMVQKEFALKLLADHGRNYRAVSALAQHCFNIETIMRVDRESFYPQPKVESMLLRLVQRERVSEGVVRGLKLLFSYRGRKVVNALKHFNIAKPNINMEKRVEQLRPSESVDLAMMIGQQRRLLQPIR
jgi:16S rRNA (adenine1518-N6/adenine1519-N6)-dimethyltransferase